MLEYLYLLTFFSWIPLALLASSQRDQRSTVRRLWALCGMTFLLCVYLLYLEFVWSKTVIAPIRVDLLLLIPIGTITFSAVGIWGLSRRGATAKVASTLLLIMALPTLGVYAEGMWKAQKGLVRLNARPALLFEAQFRNARTFQNFFGTIDTGRDPRAGHFRAEDPNGSATRVIINDRGQFWLMMKCYSNAECVHSQATLGALSLPATFKAQPPIGLPVDIVVSQWSSDRLTLSFRHGRTETFIRAPVAFLQAVQPRETVTYVGSFVQTRIDRDYAYLVQVWLWESGDRWLAYYVRRNAKCGSTTDFVSASAFAGTPASDRISFKSMENATEDLDRFEIHRPAPGADRLEGAIFYRGQPLEPLTLTKGSIVHFPLYESAPLTDFGATVDWLKTASMGESTSWKAECRS